MIFDPSWKTGHVIGPYKENELQYRDHPELAGAAAIASNDVDLRPDLPPIHTQLAQDCCAHATSTLAWVMAQVLRIALPFPGEPSVLHLYGNARLRARPREPLRDEGSILAFMFEGAAEDGLVAEKDWPETVENIDAIPPDDVWRTAERAVLTGARKLSDGAGSVPELIAALRRRRPSTICMRVDERFGGIGADVYTSPGGLIVGSHCMLVVGYISSVRAFIIRNSWGESFGDLGYALVHEDIVARLSYEKYTFDVGRMVVR